MSTLDNSRRCLNNSSTTEYFKNIVEEYNENKNRQICIDNCEEGGKMSPSIWGPKAWDFLHTLSFAYPDNPSEKEKESMFNFFNSLPDVLPCKMCAEHCRKNLSDIPPQVESKNSLSRWLVDFHNEVNRQNEKPIFKYEDVKSLYQSSTCNH